MKEFAKIGKSIFKQLSSHIDIYKVIDAEPLSVESDLDKLIRESGIQISFDYEIEQPEKMIITEHHRLSRTQILQYILFHFFNVDERGVICGISEKMIANILGCTIKTVRNNNELLERIGLIYYSSCGTGINIMINNYRSYFEENGSGYLELDFNRFVEFKNIKHINSLRLELRKELIYDNNEIKRKYKKDHSPCKISFNDFKNFAPKYTHYRGMLEYIVENGESAFDTEIKGSYIYFTLKEGKVTGKTRKEGKKEEYTKLIQEYIAEKKCSEYFYKKDIDDFVQLAFEYSIERVIPALESMIYKEFVLGEEVTKNPGGKVRATIRKNIASETHMNPLEKIIS